MHRKVFIILLAIALWPLGSEALTREDFLVQSDSGSSQALFGE